MKRLRGARRQQRAAVFTVLLMFQFVLVLLQLWLFVSVIEGTVAGGSPIAVTAMIVSFVCFAINTWMLAGVVRLDRAG